jgi:hypothetical protein
MATIIPPRLFRAYEEAAMKILLKVFVILTIVVIVLVVGSCKSRPAAEKPGGAPTRIEAVENGLRLGVISRFRTLIPIQGDPS